MYFGSEARKDFLIDSNTIILNHGSLGCIPRVVFNKRIEILQEMEKYPDEFYDFRYKNLLSDSITTLCSMINCQPKNIVLTTNATQAIQSCFENIVFKRGDNLLISNHIYPSVQFLVEEHSKIKDFNIHIVELEQFSNQSDFLNHLKHLFTETTFRAVVMDHITSRSSLVLPVKNIVELCKQFKIISLIDGAHTPGQMEINLDNIDADYYVGNLHKWMFVPRSCSFIRIHDQYITAVKPSIISYKINNVDPVERFLNQGTIDFSQYLTIPTAIEFINKSGGLNKIMSYCNEMVCRGCEILTQTLETSTYVLDAFEKSNNMRLVLLPEIFITKYKTQEKIIEELKIYLSPLNDKRELSSKRIIVKIVNVPSNILFRSNKKFHFNSLDLYLRISASIYNTIDDYIEVAKKLKNLMNN